MMLTIGQQLKTHREARGLSLEEIAQKTHIRLDYLIALEADDLEAIPSPIQRRGFLRLYASELGIEIDDLTSDPAPESLQLATEAAEAGAPSPDIPDPTPAQPEGEQPLEVTPDPQATPDSEDSSQLETEPPSDSPTPIHPPFKGMPSEALAPLRTHQQPSETDVRHQQSTQIFKMLGKRFKDRRELLSLSLENINAAIHLRQHYLEAIEAGDFDHLPSPVQAKGMLTNYAEFLNLDVDQILLDYADGLQMERLEKQDNVQKTRSARELFPRKLRLKNFFSLDLLVITALFVGFAAFVIFGVSRILAVDSPPTEATDLPEVADMLLATGSPTARQTLTPNGTSVAEETEEVAVVETTPLFTPGVSNYPINLILIAQQRTWVQVTIDSEIAFQGRLIPGNAYDFSGEDTAEILTGNAGALQVYFNDEDLGSLGLYNQVVSLIFTDSGLVLPTPTQTPTITETPETTPTPSGTPSPTPTLEEND